MSSSSPPRIRFAPLPNPHALNADANDDDDDRPCSLSSTSTLPPSKPTTQQLLSHRPTNHPPTWHKPKSRNLLRPFPFRRSTTPTNDSPRPLSKEEIFTLGTINLFRTSSKSTDTPKSEPSTSSSGWRFRFSSSSTGVPLSRTQSAQPSTTTTPRPPRHRGTPMLNGRIYGRKKRTDTSTPANPFANARDEDPEFVEWGYGGMGSVRGAQHAGIAPDGRARWERLQQGDAAFMAGATPKKGVGGAEDEEDGSGMGWVKKRKEARERAEREKKEREREKAGEVTTNVAPVVEEPVLMPALEHNLRTVTPRARVPSPTLSSSESESHDEDDEEDEEEEEETPHSQKTAHGKAAGVEKVSRHHE